MVTFGSLSASLSRAERSLRRLEESQRKLVRRSRGLSRILDEVRETLKSGRGQRIRGVLYKATRLATTLLEDLDFLDVRADRLGFKVRNVILDANHGLSGLGTLSRGSVIRHGDSLASRILSQRGELVKLKSKLVAQRSELKNASIKAEWHYKIDLCIDLFRSGFDELALSRLIELCYGPDTPGDHRRRALNELLSWGHTSDSSELTLLATNHVSSYSNRADRATASERELVLRMEGLRTTRSFTDPEVLLLLLDAVSRPTEDSLLAAANLVTNLEVPDLPEVGKRLQLLWINKALSLRGLEPIEFNAKLSSVLFDQVDCDLDESTWVTNGAKVSVIVPAWNSAEWLPTAIRGLTKQSWRNLEILIVDDCSDDHTLEIARHLALSDSRIKVIANESNRGAYASRNAALEISTGSYITVHDADDWSHPRKIERQMAHLQRNGNLVANLSQSVRIDPGNLIFFAQYGREFIRQNSSSLLFTRDLVFQELGYWDEVKFGADTEFHHRIKARFGPDSAPPAKLGLLSLTRFHSMSLTGGGKNSTRRGIVGARRDYLGKFDAWHNKGKESGESLYMPRAANPRPFAIPSTPILDEEERATYDLLVIANLSIVTPWLAKVFRYVRNLHQDGKEVAFLHIPAIERPTQGISEAFEQLVSDGAAVRIYAGTNTHAGLALIQASSMREANVLTPDLTATSVQLVLDALVPQVDLAEAISVVANVLGNQPLVFGADRETKQEMLTQKPEVEVSNRIWTVGEKQL